MPRSFHVLPFSLLRKIFPDFDLMSALPPPRGFNSVEVRISQFCCILPCCAFVRRSVDMTTIVVGVRDQQSTLGRYQHSTGIGVVWISCQSSCVSLKESFDRMSSHANPLNWFEIPVNDLTRAGLFCEAVLGVEITESGMGPKKMDWIPVEMGAAGSGGTLIRA